MKGVRQSNVGYTMLEAVIATAIIGIVLTAAVSGFAFILRGERSVTTQNQLDSEARLLLERLRSDLWLTAKSEIVLYPAGEGPYTAISFPVIRSEGAVEVDEEGRKVWDATVVYHLWEGEDFQVRRTEFNPRLAMSMEERQEQLADVVAAGSGSTAANGANSSTRAVVKNLVDWEINITAARFDAYNATESSRRILLGSAILDSGRQEITFRAVGKNRASRNSSRFLGIDFLNPTASGLPFEGEYLEVVESIGATTTTQNMPTNETWSGNARLWFPGTADDHEFTLAFTNDMWMERNFLGTGDKKDRVERVPATVGGISTFDLRLEGSGVVWRASDQTGDTILTNRMSINTSTDVRVLLRGDDPYEGFEGGWLEFNGSNVWVHFTNHSAWARISNAYIGESEISPAHGIRAGTSNQILFAGGSGAVTFAGSVTSAPVAYGIERTNSYIVGFTIEPARVGFDTQDGWPSSVSLGNWSRTTFMGTWLANSASLLAGVGRNVHPAPLGGSTNAINLDGLNSYLYFPAMRGPLDLTVWTRLNNSDTAGTRSLLLYYWSGTSWFVVGERVVPNTTDWTESSWTVNATVPVNLLLWRSGDTSTRELWLDDLRIEPHARVWDGPAGSTNAFVRDSGGSWNSTSRVIAVSQVRSGYPASGNYLSAVIDTTVANPVYNPMTWSAVLPAGYNVAPTLTMQIRADSDASMTNAAWVNALQGVAPAIHGRYVQVMATLTPGVNATTRESGTPQLQDFAVSWEAEPRFVSIEGKFSVANTHGIYEVEVNGVPMLRGVTVDLTVYKDVPMGFGEPRRIEAKAYTEIVPRN